VARFFLRHKCIGTHKQISIINHVTHSFTKSSRKNGFTLFEMMVSISIFVLITLIGVLNYRKFGNDLFITNLGYDMALSIRKAQSYGINVKGYSTNESDESFDYAYGVHFSVVRGESDSVSYVLFQDNGNGESGGIPNGKYDGGEEIETFNLLRGSYISLVCATPSPPQSQSYCGVYNGLPVNLDITFRRPNPDAVIKINDTSNPNATYKNAEINIASADGMGKVIKVSAIGQISVTDD